MSQKISAYQKQLVAVLTAFVILLAIATIIIAAIAVAKENKSTTTSASTTSTTAPDSTLPSWPSPSNSFMGRYLHAAVASDNGMCSEIGRNIMIKGGNAVDAIIAADLCTGVLTPHSAGLGGGFFLTIYNRTTQTCHVIDAREEAPQNSSVNMFDSMANASEYGYLGIAVPGELHGLWTAFQKFGSGHVTWADILQPIIDLCINGFPVSSALGSTIRSNAEFIYDSENHLDIFINNLTGQLYQEGEIMRRPVLGKTLKLLAEAENPAELFYNGSIAANLTNEIQAGGGILTLDDFAKYQAKLRPPVDFNLTHKNLRACGPPPPSSAGLIEAIFNVMEGYDVTSENVSTVDSAVQFYHVFIEAMKFVYAARSELADIDFYSNAAEVIKNVTSPEWADQIRQMITNKSHNLTYYGGGFQQSDHGTSHMNAVDPDGNAAALTSTINSEFGCKRRSPSTGIIFNDEMDDFSQPNRSNSYDLAPSPSNFISPGKRPQSSMSPTILVDSQSGAVKLVAGASGGSQIISGVANDAIDTPRLHNQLRPYQTEFESGFPDLFVKLLETERDQILVPMDFDNLHSVVSAIFRDADGILTANSDFRKAGGYPAGF